MPPKKGVKGSRARGSNPADLLSRTRNLRSNKEQELFRFKSEGVREKYLQDSESGVVCGTHQEGGSGTVY